MIHGGWRDGNVLFQEVQYQFAHRIDLIGIGVLQEFLSFEAIGFFQDGLQEGQLTSQTFHPVFILPTVSDGNWKLHPRLLWHPFFYTVYPCRA